MARQPVAAPLPLGRRHGAAGTGMPPVRHDRTKRLAGNVSAVQDGYPGRTGVFGNYETHETREKVRHCDPFPLFRAFCVFRSSSSKAPRLRRRLTQLSLRLVSISNAAETRIRDLWAISDGGARIGSATPAFAGLLSEQDRWRIIRYLRTL